jgi:putative hydrolase of HD superfamily
VTDRDDEAAGSEDEAMGGDSNEATSGDADEWTDEDAGDPIDALEAGFALKDERRTGWQLRGVDDPESVAAHTWGVSLLCLAFADEAGVDPDRALRLAVVHDLAEARTGDAPTRVDPEKEPLSSEEKERRERAAMAELARPFPLVEEAWEAYERRDTPVARFVKDMDLVDMCLQALVYERGERYAGESDSEFAALDEFFATAEPRLSTDVGRRLFEEIRARYETLRERETDD